MSTALALASVTAVLRESIRDAFVDHSVTSIVPDAVVTAVAPDRIPLDAGPPGLNVYLYLTSPNAGWRNVGLPSRSGDGARLSNPPLALDLHYMLTAYGTDDLHAEVLLGVAMQRFHEVPVLDRETVRTTLAAGAILSGRLADSNLADQVELVKLSPEPLGAEQLSKLWSAFTVSYRPSASYVASVVLVEADVPVRTALPVLTRGPVDTETGEERGVVAVPSAVPQFPTLTAAVPPDAKPAAQLGDAVRLEGHHLDGTAHEVHFEHARLGVAHTLAPATAAADALTVALPSIGVGSADWPVGVYTVRATVTRDGDALATNALALPLAPLLDRITHRPGHGQIAVRTAPHVRPEQTVSLVVGEREVPPEPITVATRQLRFPDDDFDAGTYVVRLRVDGIESVFIDRTASPPVFDPSQQVVVT